MVSVCPKIVQRNATDLDKCSVVIGSFPEVDMFGEQYTGRMRPPVWAALKCDASEEPSFRSERTGEENEAATYVRCDRGPILSGQCPSPPLPLPSPETCRAQPCEPALGTPNRFLAANRASSSRRRGSPAISAER